ncbi:hypothetical protein BD560DRAFT_148939 [Blakeslea trispora]|nr:hypothetical protein BD560DRAFT_148939 [Blakeslea trispora]
MHLKTLLPSTSSQLSTSKTFAPVKLKKSNSNTLDMFLKRTVDVKASVPISTETLHGEAAQAAIAKVNRSALNGRPTMKRSGSFTSSAQAAKKQKKKKTEPSMLSSQQETTGTVILRRSNNIPNTEETTPRTSMNRYLGTNLFADFSETCPVCDGNKNTYLIIILTKKKLICIVTIKSYGQE